MISSEHLAKITDNDTIVKIVENLVILTCVDGVIQEKETEVLASESNKIWNIFNLH